MRHFFNFLSQLKVPTSVQWLYVFLVPALSVLIVIHFSLFNNPFAPFFLYALPAVLFFSPLRGSIAIGIVIVVGNILFSRAPEFDPVAMVTGDLEIVVFNAALMYMIHLFQLTRKQTTQIVSLEIEKAKLQAQEEYRHKRSELLVVVDHELKTPITTITMYADLLYINGADIKGRAALAILGETERINTSINTILSSFES